jgi:hypothetical protein
VSPKSPTLAAAAVLVAVIGAGFAFVGVLLLAVAAGAVAFLQPDGTIGMVVALIGVTGLVAGGIGVGSAVGLWLGRPWGWAGSMAIAVIGSLGAAVALASAGPQAQLLAGTVLVVAAVALLLAPRTRAAAGLG